MPNLSDDLRPIILLARQYLDLQREIGTRLKALTATHGVGPVAKAVGYSHAGISKGITRPEEGVTHGIVAALAKLETPEPEKTTWTLTTKYIVDTPPPPITGYEFQSFYAGPGDITASGDSPPKPTVIDRICARWDNLLRRLGAA